MKIVVKPAFFGWKTHADRKSRWNFPSNRVEVKVETPKRKYRIGAIIRNETIWLVRFLPRKKIYKEFP
jgi:hypothetical protein